MGYNRKIDSVLCFLAACTPAYSQSDLSCFDQGDCLFSELAVVEEVDQKIGDKLPFIYNYVMMGGYFNMPSARMNEVGTIAFGGGIVNPYSVYGLNFQIFSHIELAANYRLYTGILDPTFGHQGFGEDADRIGNIKIAFTIPSDHIPFLPDMAIGAEDFFGSGRFRSKYVVFTKELLQQNWELTFGWGNGRIKGPFGGLAWTPFRKTNKKFLKDLSLVAEYDAIDYKKHKHEHPEGREVNFRLNGGVVYRIADIFQFSVSSVRGNAAAGFISCNYPLGSTTGFMTKVDEPPLYTSPTDIEPLGVRRPEPLFSKELAYALLEQGLDLYTLYLTYEDGKKVLWMKVINNRYWQATEVKRRLEHVLTYILPSDIMAVTAVIEANGIPTHQYHFYRSDLELYRTGKIGEYELDFLSPMQEPGFRPDPYDSLTLFRRKKSIWTVTFRPRVLTFFGSASGKFKYCLSAIAAPEGYLFDEIYYSCLLSYNIKSSVDNLGDCDVLNRSQIINVRSDSVRYFQTNTVALEQAYLQKSWNLPKSWFARVAVGYFEAAYAGVASELLYYPINSNWAFGIEGAYVKKRKYEGLGLSKTIRKFEGSCPTYLPYYGLQYFLNLYFVYPALQIDAELSGGQFLAKDKGVRLDVGRYFNNGLRVGLWYTWTNGHDVVNCSTYHDKGVMISMPLDFFLRKSSKSFIGYSMAAWLRDVGAISATGKGLYPTLFEERYY